MFSLEPALTELLRSLPLSPYEQQELDAVVRSVLEKYTARSLDNKKSEWEYLLKRQVFKLAMTEGKAVKENGQKYYAELQDLLDLVLTFTEQNAVDQSFPFVVLQELLETQTIASCSHIFTWLESRAPRLTNDMEPQKGKALVLLRTLNDLLRRISKMGSNTVFCGRILMFLSGVFPLGERSGVNLRGEYGPMWEGVKDTEDKMDVDEKAGLKEKQEFYNTFWSLQLPFSRPSVLTSLNVFTEFKDSVNKVLPVIKEATAKERAMMGKASTGLSSLKRKREPDVMDGEEASVTEYFFAKFLTSPELLDLEIADTHFRRQILFQLLILLNHLLTFTKVAKASWVTPKNRSLQMDFTLEPNDEKWVQETYTKAMEELRQTAPGGRAFAETVNAILEREKNWIKWKAELCQPFDREAWSTLVDNRKVGFEEATREYRKRIREPPKDWEWRLGSKALTDIWDEGYRDLSDLEMPFLPGDVDDFVKELKREDKKIELRQKTLAKLAPRAPTPQPIEQTTPVASTDMVVDAPETAAAPTEQPATKAQEVPSQPAPAPAPPTDKVIISLQENKNRITWLALRTARDQHLQHFGKIGTGDIELLSQEIEKEKLEKEKQREKEKEREEEREKEKLKIEEEMVANMVNPVDSSQPVSLDGGGDIRME